MFRVFEVVRGVCPHFVPIWGDCWGQALNTRCSDQGLLWCADRDLNPEPVD